MLHNDVPTPRQMRRLATEVGPTSVTLYVPTEGGAHSLERNRVALSNATREALQHVADRAEVEALREEFDDLVDDEDFLRHQSRTLVVLATPLQIRIYRVPNRLEPSVTVDDRFFVKPLLRSTTFPQAAFVLAFSSGAVRLIQMDAEQPAEEVKVPGMPTDAADHAGKSSLGDRAPKRRVQGLEGRKMRVRQYARAVDLELRTVLAGLDLPLVLASTQPSDGLYRSVNTYPALLDESIDGNPDEMSPDDLDTRAREVLDRHYAAELDALTATFRERDAQGRGRTDLSDIARAAAFGAVETLFLDIDSSVPGTVDAASGEIHAGDSGQMSAALGHDVVNEIARLTLLSDGRIVAVRGGEVPGNGAAAATLRFVI